MGAVYLKNGAISGTENGGIVFYAQNWPSDGNLVIVGLLAWKIKFIALKHFCENGLVFSQKCLSAIIPLIKYWFCQLKLYNRYLLIEIFTTDRLVMVKNFRNASFPVKIADFRFVNAEHFKILLRPFRPDFLA